MSNNRHHCSLVLKLKKEKIKTGFTANIWEFTAKLVITKDTHIKIDDTCFCSPIVQLVVPLTSTLYTSIVEIGR